jgi:hypothetical protein
MFDHDMETARKVLQNNVVQGELHACLTMTSDASRLNRENLHFINRKNLHFTFQQILHSRPAYGTGT